MGHRTLLHWGVWTWWWRLRTLLSAGRIRFRTKRPVRSLNTVYDRIPCTTPLLMLPTIGSPFSRFRTVQK